jgi:cell division transport system permease protein
MKRAATRKNPRPKTIPRQNPVPKAVQAGVFDAWLAHHYIVLHQAFVQFFTNPIATLMTATVIGIALALPAGLLLLLQNVQYLSKDWGGNVQISLFLSAETTNQQAHQLAAELQQQYNLNHIRVISREEALAEYKALSGFADALQVLEHNPLPPVLVLTPQFSLSQPEQAKILLQQLQNTPMVDVAQYDMLWLQRMFAMLKIIQQAVLLLGFLLALSVLLVVGNTIRLAIYNRREEIEITKLFGATDGFIRRPFLYMGLYYGLSGGIIAWLLVSIALHLLAQPVQELSNLYHNEYNIIGFDIISSLSLLLIGAGLGWIGAWLAVGQHLSRIQPR